MRRHHVSALIGILLASLFLTGSMASRCNLFDDDNDNSELLTLIAIFLSLRNNGGGATPGSVTVSIISGNTSENGAQATFTVVLGDAPSADVTIGVSSSNTNEGTVSTASLTFTNVNWSTPQTVTVTGVNDLVVDGNTAYSIILAPAVSSDSRYGGVDPADIAVFNLDNDSTPGSVTVSAISGNTSEWGTQATFTVVLNDAPAANVTIGVSSGNTNEGTVSTASLLFTTTNWSNIQTVTVTGVNDFASDGDTTYTILLAPAVSADPRYNGVDPANVTVVNRATDSIPGVNAWKYYTLSAQTNGFYNVTLTDGDGAGPDNPDLYLSYLGVTTNPVDTACINNWVACDTTTNTTATLSNYYVGNSLSRKMGVYTQSGTNVAFTLNSTFAGVMPQGCFYTFANSAPMTIGGGTFSASPSVPGNTNFYFVILNNSATNAKNHTVRLTFSGLTGGDTIDTRTYALTDVNVCTNIELGSTFLNCAASPCDRTYTLNAGDFLLYAVSLTDAGGGGASVNYTLQALP